MSRVLFSPEFAQVFGNFESIEVEVDGLTVRDCLQQAARRVGGGIGEAIFRGDDRSPDTLAPDVKVVVDGRELGDVDALDARVREDSQLVIAPLKGSAGPMDNV